MMKIKDIITVTAVCLSVMMACVSCLSPAEGEQVSGLEPAKDPEPIVFGIQAATRAPLEGTVLPNNSQFSVYATEIPSLDNGVSPGDPNLSAKSFFYNQKITKKSDTELTYGKYYWPDAELNSRLRFFAVYPVSATGVSYSGYTSSAPPYMQTTMTVNTNPTSHVDIMYAVTDLLDRETVNIEFRHALTRIDFVARLDPEMEELQADYPDMEIFIEKLTLTNVARKGIFKVYEPGNVVWEPSATVSDIASIELAVGSGLEKIVLQCGDPVLENDYENIISDGIDLMLIPQPLYPIELAVDLNITMGVDGEEGPQSEKNRFILPIDQNALWLPGRHITYKLNVAKDVVVSGARVAEWKIVDTGEIHVFN